MRFLAEIDAVAEFVGITGAPMGSRDRADDPFLETALTADCQVIISGNQDLRTLDPWQGIRILSPAQALLDEASVVATMAYVDRNLIRAGMAETPEQSDYTSIQQRVIAFHFPILES